MGGVEDDEPPSKRVKVSSVELGGFSNGASSRDLASNSLSDSMARPLESQGDDEFVGSKGTVKKTEFVRIITEALYSLGYKKTGAHLEEESGIALHSSLVNLFMQQILDGKWVESVYTLHQIGLSDETVKLASFIILEQKFFELLDGGSIMDALKTLRTEITPLCINNGRVRELSSCILSPSRSFIPEVPDHAIVRVKSRSKLLEELQKMLPPKFMIPEKRLIHLVEQALDLQLDSCKFHNSLVGEMSLLTDHQCGKDQIPCQTLQVLREHCDEVWCLQFSHNGKYLASSSIDHSVIIWQVVEVDGRVSLKYRLSGHQKPVSHISWSPDDLQLLTCGVEEAVRRWDVSSGECLHVYEKNGVGLVSCGWATDSKMIFSGATDKSISMWELDGKELECWRQKTVRTSDMGITKDGKQIVTACKDNMILLFGWESKSEKLIIEDQSITSFVLSSDNKFLLVSLLNQEIHLWNIEGSIKLVAKYKGHKRSRYVVRPCFGGLGQAFIASGSEDSQVYIWHRSSGELVGTLHGHSGIVNCVSWNPANPHMLASASDDRTIRIWGLNQVKITSNGKLSNGVHCCNGAT